MSQLKVKVDKDSFQAGEIVGFGQHPRVSFRVIGIRFLLFAAIKVSFHKNSDEKLDIEKDSF